MDSKAIAQSTIEASVYAGIGAAVANATTNIKPAGGALFGTIAFLSGKVIAEGFNGLFGDSSAAKILKVAAEIFGGLLVALGVMMQIGYKINYSVSLTLAPWMISFGLAVELAKIIIMNKA